jgi:CHAD domain-containing protein
MPEGVPRRGPIRFMKPRELFCRWRRRTTKLLEAREELLRLCSAASEPDHVHQLRVTLRRLRLVLRLGAPCFGKTAIVEFHDWSREVSDALGRVRDLDVTLEWLRRQPESAALASALESRRHRWWRSRRSRLPLPPDDLRAQLNRWKAKRRAPARLVKLYSKYFRLHREEIVRVAPQLLDLAPPQRHAFRRTLRRLRYLRELALSRRQQRSDQLLKHLVRLQEALGDHQNCGVAQAILDRMKSAPSLRRLRRALAGERRQSETRIQHELQSLVRVRGWKTQGFLP